jgi:hypothetical protein
MMSRGLKVGSAGVTAVLMACVVALLVWQGSQKDGDVLAGWGQGSLSKVERAFYARRVKRIVDFWQAAADWTSQWRKGGRIEQPNDIFLVIDAKKTVIWVEYKGQVVEELYSEWPGGMEWSVHRLTPEGSQDLSGIVRLQVRGNYTSKIVAETIYLAGLGRGWNMNFQIKAHTCGFGLGTGETLVVPKYNGELPEDDDPYGSIIVSEQEYNAYLTELENRDKGGIQEGIVESLFHGSNVLRENLSHWHRMEKQLYAEIDRQLWQMGYEMNRAEVEPGPDYLAGHAEIRGQDDSWFNSRSVEVNLKYEYLGEDVWYVVSVPGLFLASMRMGSTIELEFLVSVTEDVASDEADGWLTKGRSIMRHGKPGPSQWQVELDNGVVVELIGLCENPSGGKTWFGPDGSELDFVPYQNFKRYGKKGDERLIYEFAWRVHWPSRGPNGSTGSVEGSSGSYYHQILDKYGYGIIHQIEGFNAEGYSFKEGQDKTTLNLGYRIGQADYSHVRFENISLVRGKDMGSKVVLGKEDL